MRHHLIALIGVVCTLLGLSGCSSDDRSAATQLTLVAPTMAAPAVEPGPLPAPEALADVVYRLADPGVPGIDKLALVQATAPADAAAFDRFGAALGNTGFTPITVTAADVRWSPSHPGDVLATVRIASTGPDPAAAAKPGEFNFPMEFARSGPGWQLTRETAEMLLAFGNAQTPAAAPTPPP